MNSENTQVVPEDIFFTKAMIDYNIGTVAPWEIAHLFSQESIPVNLPLGGHQFSLQIINTTIYVFMNKLIPQ